MINEAHSEYEGAPKRLPVCYLSDNHDILSLTPIRRRESIYSRGIAGIAWQAWLVHLVC